MSDNVEVTLLYRDAAFYDFEPVTPTCRNDVDQNVVIDLLVEATVYRKLLAPAHSCSSS